MKQFAIATLVGAAVVFVLQALSWMALPIHKDTFRYTPQQDTLLAMMSRSMPSDGVYALPNLPPEKQNDQAAQEALHTEHAGKPWAMVHFHRSFDPSMGGSMLRGFLINLLSVALVVWLLGAVAERFATFGQRFTVVMAFAAFLLLQGDLTQLNWWETPWHFMKGEVIDHLMCWAACGAWLGWYLGRK